MKNKGSVPILSSISLTLVFVAVLVMVPYVKPAASKPIVLNWATFVPKEQAPTKNIVRGFIDRVNQESKGELVLKYRGGPETIPAFDLGKAVQKGVVDIGIVPVGFYEPIAPGIGGAMLTRVSLDDERKPGGGYDYLVELHKKGGLFYLGRGTPSDEYFRLNLNKKLNKPEDFVGTKIGTATVARACTMGWKATAVSVKMAEYYTAMERGLVDGISSCPLTTWVAFGCHEVTKYSVDHGYYQSTVALIMNLNKWNQLPAHLRTLMTKSMIQSEKDNKRWDAEDTAKARKKMVEAGVEFYKFSPDVAKWFIETAYEAGWEYQMKRFPKETPKLKELLSGK